MWQGDNLDPRNVSAYLPATGGAVVKTASYTAIATDDKKLLSFNSASAVTLTLPATPPSLSWAIFVENINSGILTISRNGLTIDNAAADLTLHQDQGVYLTTDGTNYFTERGMGGGAVFPVVFSYVGRPLAGATVGIATIPYYPDGSTMTVTLAANFLGAAGSLGNPPTASATYTVWSGPAGPTQIGSVSVSTGGVFTFSTTSGTAKTFTSGGRMLLLAPNPQDATLSDVGITFSGKRS